MTTTDTVSKQALRDLRDEALPDIRENLNAAEAAAKAAYEKIDSDGAMTKADILAYWRPAYDAHTQLSDLLNAVNSKIDAGAQAQPNDGGTGKTPPPNAG